MINDKWTTDLLNTIIATTVGGFIVGLFMLWIEYSYFIPLYILTPEPPPLPIYSYTPGELFYDYLPDSSTGPQMVVIPGGRFRMGDIQGSGAKWEQPVHSVFVDSFAIGRYEITFAEYDHFATATGRKTPSDYGWGRGPRPVINVSWRDATAYTEWLSLQTGRTYRLPTEAEWEYAARADTETKYWWGNEIGSNWANCDGCGSQWDNKKTAPVGSFMANPFKLHEILGNVYEWTCSEYDNKYNGKEQRCLKEINDHRLGVVRGGSWYSSSRFVRTSNRYRFPVDYRDHNVGFRVVRVI